MERHEGGAVQHSEGGQVRVQRCGECVDVSFPPQMKIIVALVVIALLLVIISEYRRSVCTSGMGQIADSFQCFCSSSNHQISLAADEEDEGEPVSLSLLPLETHPPAHRLQLSPPPHIPGSMVRSSGIV